MSRGMRVLLVCIAVLGAFIFLMRNGSRPSAPEQPGGPTFNCVVKNGAEYCTSPLTSAELKEINPDLGADMTLYWSHSDRVGVIKLDKEQPSRDPDLMTSPYLVMVFPDVGGPIVTVYPGGYGLLRVPTDHPECALHVNIQMMEVRGAWYDCPTSGPGEQYVWVTIASPEALRVKELYRLVFLQMATERGAGMPDRVVPQQPPSS